MAGFNKVILMGNMTKDPEKVEVNGKAITNARIAINKAWINDSGNKVENTTFVDIKSFGKNAENIAKFFTKGKPIMVEGHLNVDEWNDKNTKEKRSRMYVIVETFQFVGTNGASTPSQNGVQATAPKTQSKVASQVAPKVVSRPTPQVELPEYQAEEIPF